MKKVFIENIEITEDHIGQHVIYNDGFSPEQKGVISSFDEDRIWIKFPNSNSGQRCESSRLKWM